MMEVGFLAAAVLAPPEPARAPAPRLLGLPGLENVGLVAPGLYRGSAPEGEGLDTLKRLGVRTVVNLRHYHGDSEEKECLRRGLAYERVVLESSDAPRDEDVRRFLALATDPARRPLYFHCWRGKDRTGAFCAAYRLAVEGWSLPEAQNEMKEFGFFPGWRDLWDWVSAFSRTTERAWPSRPGPP
jgi:protein tyrosine/serine phosphatase